MEDWIGYGKLVPCPTQHLVSVAEEFGQWFCTNAQLKNSEDEMGDFHPPIQCFPTPLLTCYPKSHPDVELLLPPPRQLRTNNNNFLINVRLFRLHAQLKGNKLQTVIN